MKKVMKWRYYCDHCKKSGASKYHMERHEKICTKNPDRDCGFCGRVDNSDIKKAVELIKANTEEQKSEFGPMLDFKEPSSQKIVLDKIREMVDDCPACVLSAINQSNLAFLFRDFSFKDEKESFWKDRQPEEPEYYY